MQYKEIVSVTGESGLFQLLSSKSDGAIVRSLDGKITRFVASRNHNFTPLESIEVFTTGENVPLSDVFKTMLEKESSVPVLESGKDTAAIKQYFDKVYPELDKERVYMSDMKKMLKWYPVLKENELLNFEDEAEEVQEGEGDGENKVEVETEVLKGKEKGEGEGKAKASSKAGNKSEDKKEKGRKKGDKEPVEEKAVEKPAAAKKKSTSKKSDSEKH